MKSKKLFAILTLVAFMMTLVPAMAFGAGPADSNATKISFTSDKDVVDANNSDKIEFSVTVVDKAYNPMPGYAVYFASSRGGSDTFIDSDGDELTQTAGVVCANADDQGKVTVKVRSSIAGTAVVGAALKNNNGTIFQYLDKDTSVTASGIGLVGTKEIEFKADSATTIKVTDVTVKDRKTTDNETADYGLLANGKNGYKGVTVDYGDSEVFWGRANELDFFTINVKVTNSIGAPVGGQEVSFFANKASCYFSKTKVTTDSAGVAKVNVYASKAGIYEVVTKAGTSTKTSYISFEPAEVSKVVLKSDNNRLLAKDANHVWKFEFQDINGNRLDLKNTDLDTVIASIDAVEYPDGGEFKTAYWDKVYDNDDKVMKIFLDGGRTFTKEGNYKYRVTLNNGQYADFSFEIKKQGDYVAIDLSYEETVLPMDTLSGAPDLVYVDAAGVEKDADFSGVSLSLSDYNKTQSISWNEALEQYVVDDNGAKIMASTGVFKTTKEKDYVGDLIVTVFDNANKLSDSVTISIARELAGLKVVEPSDKIEVGKVGTVKIKFVNIDGEQVALGQAGTVSLDNAYPISKPEGAIVEIEEDEGFVKGLKGKGEANLLVKSNKAGDAVCFVNVNIGGKAYTATFKVSFGEPKKVVEGKTVVMFIGSCGYMQDNTAKMTDVAPFIENGRTFVAVRPIAEAFGCEVGWNEATQTVTLTRDEITVTIVIGSKDISVTKDGVVTTVEADVPAFIKDGRTVLPFRACGDAFGATTNWDEATQSVTYLQ